VLLAAVAFDGVRLRSLCRNSLKIPLLEFSRNCHSERPPFDSLRSLRMSGKGWSRHAGSAPQILIGSDPRGSAAEVFFLFSLDRFFGGSELALGCRR